MPSILLIEDDEALRETLAKGLADKGYVVEVAGDGEQGMRLMRAEPVDVVVTDIVMPNVDGTETIKRMRAAFPQLIIIAISGGPALNASLYLRVAKAIGADSTLNKPFMLQTLINTIDEIREGKAASAERPPKS